MNPAPPVPPTDLGDAAPARARKSAEAYRTISEVADELHVPQHVLRFWETKFPRIKPLKRGGGRRYYRPDDVGLLRRIADLLYIQGYTIKGVQRLLKEGGGALHEEIPPASEEERAAAAAERAATSGLAAATITRPDVPELPIGPSLCPRRRTRHVRPRHLQCRCRPTSAASSSPRSRPPCANSNSCAIG